MPGALSLAGCEQWGVSGALLRWQQMGECTPAPFTRPPSILSTGANLDAPLPPLLEPLHGYSLGGTFAISAVSKREPQ
ncbi:hypothetical protein JTE90_028439 [Oedothorax gibbosus]|uniref:Uncharacterized protein n=1 Tax=Oedothorax gibbosus TaxID=931172 RepID=A0AAV6VH41_9ARAC|nr:hypothetical protein JTE90_028439 [Oedothorax gibbosus]